MSTTPERPDEDDRRPMPGDVPGSLMWRDGQYSMVYSGPTRLEQRRVMARDLERDGWLTIEPGWVAEHLRRLLRG